MTFARIFSARTLWLCAASLFAVGCGDSTTTTADASVTQDVVTAQDASVAQDVVSAQDASVTRDVVTAQDAVTAQDVVTAQDGGALAATPAVVAASTTGHDRLFGLAFAPNGSFYAVGTVADSTETTADFRTAVARFTASGTLDTSFGTSGYATHNLAVGTNGEVARGVAVQSTGKVVAVATVEHVGGMEPRDRDIALVRFNADGSRDASFGTDGVVRLDLSEGAVDGTAYVADGAWSVTAYPDDRLVVVGVQRRAAGTDSDFAVVRLSANGMRDTTFGTNGVAAVDINNRSADARTGTILADGSVVVAGYMNDGGVVKPVLFKLTPAGQLDASFGTGGIYVETVLAAATEAYAARLQGTSFVTAGYGRASAMENLDWLSLRINATGQRDLTYGNAGVARLDRAGFNDNARDLVVLPDDRVMLVGGGRASDTNSDGMIAVLTANGQRDTTWGEMGRRVYDFGGGSDFFWAVALSPDRSRVALVGTRAIATGMTGNDDGVVFVLPAR